MPWCTSALMTPANGPGRPSRRWCPERSLGCCTGCPPRSRTCSTSSQAGRPPSAASGRSRSSPLTSPARSPSGSNKPGRSWLARPTARSWGFRGTCDNYLFGPSRNPFDTAKNTGGSSGGSAGAVADGLLPFAEGTDGGGSIRIPASWCGVYGYKPSFGRVPQFGRPNAFGHGTPFLFEGPIAREVEDAALVLSAIAGYDS